MGQGAAGAACGQRPKVLDCTCCGQPNGKTQIAEAREKCL